MMTATGTRAEARKHLAGRWNKGALIAFCYFIVEWVLELIGTGLKNNAALSLAYQIVFFIISVPISYGFIISFVKLKRGEDIDAFGFLKIGFNNFSRAWSIAWNKFLKMIVPAILMILCIILTSVYITMHSANDILSRASNAKIRTEIAQDIERADLSYLDAQRDYSANPSSENYRALQKAQRELNSAKSRRTDYTPAVKKSSNSGLSIILIILAVIIYLACIVYLAVKSLSLYLATFIAYDDETISGKEACNLSQELMKGNKGNLFVLSLSFIGWAILSVFTLGIGLFWLTAYMNVSMVCFYEAVSNRNSEV